MIDIAMKVITHQLNRYMHQRFELDEDVVVLSTPFDADGGIASQVSNKLVVFLANLTKDTVPYTSTQHAPASGAGSSFASSVPLYLNLHVIVGSCFDAARYPESLKYLSHAVRCFQVNSVIDKETHPALDETVEKLILDIENIGIHDLGNLWGIQGGKYIPSILYRVRMVSFANDDIQSRDITASTPQTSAATQ
ncbi:hypothetical protein MNBD_GAMMA10-2848 [hydrothermal vent metagenome]|uniref:Pvc16 N-terminal domain-containing protein n=1 Tax=hydrothermal vent metagenome TaxID=652676 RepID=A0A3B0XVX2_9ZZZZ